MTTRSVGGVGTGSAQLEPVLSGVGPVPAGPAAAKQRESTRVGGNTVVTAPAPAPRGSSAKPTEVPTGTQEYYTQRLNDFVARNPGVNPPPYYLEYGDRYVRAFSALGPQDLSPEGLAWRDRTLKALQEAIETRARGKDAKFAELERDPKAFKDFAYATHAEAYLDSGLLDLPAQDLVKIMTVPELADLLNEAGLKQVFEVLEKVRPEDVQDIALATGSEAARRGQLQLQDFLFRLNKGFSEMMGPQGRAW